MNATAQPNNKRRPIRRHYESDLISWMFHSRYWEQPGVRLMNKKEREGFCDLLLVGLPVEEITGFWQEHGWPRFAPTCPRELLEMEL